MEAIKREEETFLDTLDRGMALLEKEVSRLSGKILAGAVVFKLYDTYGFPPDLTEIILRDRGIGIDQAGFEVEMEKQRERSRSASGFTREIEDEISAAAPTEFLGYEALTSDATVVDFRERPDGIALVVLDRTPFYAESGGQIGDCGEIVRDKIRMLIENTSKTAAGVYIHRGRVAGGGTFRQGETVTARVDRGVRVATERNHTATHLLHAALGSVLGDHVQQAGSYVGPDRLRFDFSHFKGMGDEELLRVERMANDAVVADLPITTKILPIEDARKLGAKAFFGDKYGDLVRVVSVEGRESYAEERITASREFCGGTHVRRTGEIGLIRVVAEAAVAAGVRRIEAVSGRVAVERSEEEHRRLAAAAAALTVPPDAVEERISRLLDEKKGLEKELARLKLDAATGRAEELVESARDIEGIRLVAAVIVDLDAATLRGAAERIGQKLGVGVVALASNPESDKGERKAVICVQVAKSLTGRIKAGELVGLLAKICGGGGGGRPELAQAGGRDASRIHEAINRVPEFIQTLLLRK